MKKSKIAKRPPNQRAGATVEDTPALWFKHLCKSFLMTLAFGFVILLVLSLAAYFYNDPNTLILPLALVGAGFTALLGGVATVRIHGHSALVCGLLNGCLLLGLMLILSLFFKGQGAGYSTGIACLLHACVPLLSVVGAYLGLQRPSKKRKRK